MIFTMRIIKHWESFAQRRCAPSILGGFEDPTGQSPEQPHLSSVATLLWAGSWTRDLLRSLSTPGVLQFRVTVHSLLSPNVQSCQKTHQTRTNSPTRSYLFSLVFSWLPLAEYRETALPFTRLRFFLYDFNLGYNTLNQHTLNYWATSWIFISMILCSI